MNLAEATLPRRRQRSANLRGMMSVIVDHRHTIGVANLLKPAVYAVEVPERFANFLHRHIQPDSNCDCRRCILNVMLAGDTQVELAEIATPIADPKAAQGHTVLAWSAAHIRNLEVGALARSVGKDAPLDRGQEPPQIIVIVAGDNHSVEGYAVHEF